MTYGEWGFDWFRQQMIAAPPGPRKLLGWHLHAKEIIVNPVPEKQLWGDGRYHHVIVQRAVGYKNWVRLRPNPGFNLFGHHWCKEHHRKITKGVFE